MGYRHGIGEANTCVEGDPWEIDGRMKVAIVADSHLINPEDPHERRRTARREFVEAWPSFRRLVDRLNEAPIDHVVFTGDLVDYYSTENRAFALELVDELEVPFHHVPGNHDFQRVSESGDEVVIETDRPAALAGWEEAGVTLDNRVLDVGGVRFLLVDSALSRVPDGTESWLRDHAVEDRYCILCTHVPVDHPAVVDAITEREPDRNLDKYVQRGAPTLYDRCLAGRIDAIFSGHLHFAAEATIDGIRQHILPMSVRRHEPRYPLEGTAAVVDTSGPGDVGVFRETATG